MHVRSSQIARLEIAHKGNSNQQRQRQHNQHWYKNKFEMLEHEHDDSGYKYSPRLGIQHKPKLNASTTYCSYLYAVWMKDGIGAILFWLTIMMLLFKNFPQDEPIIIIIFDNRQIELHYHTHHGQDVIHRDLAIFAIWWAVTKMMRLWQANKCQRRDYSQKETQWVLFTLSILLSNIKHPLLYFYFIFCTVVSFQKNFATSVSSKPPPPPPPRPSFVVSNVVCC